MNGNQQPVNQKKGLPAWAIVLIVLGGVFFFIIVGIVGCTSVLVTSINDSVNETKDKVEDDNPFFDNDDSDKEYTLGETFKFDGLEITLDTKYSFTKVDNQFSDLDGRTVVRLGATIKNISDEKNRINMFYINYFGSEGTELDSVSAYFDNSVEYAGELKPGASYNKYFYFLYDGNGEYEISFDNYSEEVTAEFNITK